MLATDVTVIIPSLNPDEKLSKTVADLMDAGFSDIILVNDGSTPEALPYFPKDLPGVTLLTHEVNRGKGAAMKTAFRHYLEREMDSPGVVTVDGDGQHLAKDVLRCAEVMCAQNAVVLGVRDFNEPHVPPRSRMGNKITSLVFRLFCGLRISDTQTGLRAIPAEYIPGMLTIEGDRYEYETNALLKMDSLGMQYTEQKIDTVYIEENKNSHFHPVRDSLRIYGLILKFISSSLIAALVDLAAFAILSILLSAFAGDWSDTVAVILARIISSAVNFLINQKAVFKSGIDGKTAVVRYYILAVAIMLLSAGSLTLITYLLGITTPDFTALKTIIKLVIDGVLFLCSFRLQRNWVFANNHR